MQTLIRSIVLMCASSALAGVHIHNHSRWFYADVTYTYVDAQGQHWSMDTRINWKDSYEIPVEAQCHIRDITYTMKGKHRSAANLLVYHVDNNKIMHHGDADTHISICPFWDFTILMFKHAPHITYAWKNNPNVTISDEEAVSRSINDLQSRVSTPLQNLIQTYYTFIVDPSHTSLPLTVEQSALENLQAQNKSLSDARKELLTMIKQACFPTVTQRDIATHIGYIVQGGHIHTDILNGDTTHLQQYERKEAIRSLIWFYFAVALANGQAFADGAFCIQDTPSFDLFAYLKSHPESAQRPSSHLKKYYAVTSQTPSVQQHYGLDFHDKELPAGKTTLLFGKVDEDTCMTFIKPEASGVNSPLDVAHHALDFGASLGRKALPSIFGTDDAPYYRKERVPQHILQRFKRLMESVYPALSQEHADQLAATNLEACKQNAAGLGIQYMYRTAKAIKHVAADTHLSPETQQELAQFVATLEQDYDHVTYRIGREVIIPQQATTTMIQNDKEAIRNWLSRKNRYVFHSEQR